jgi:glycosyltransferase involved in cell wall biosynthesis
MALKSADRVIMQTDAQLNRLIQNQPVRRDITGVVRNNIRDSLEEGTDSTRAHSLLFVGTLSYRKGIDTLLQALSLLSNSTNVHLHVAGEGPMKDKALSYTEEKGLRDRVTFHGYIQDVKKMMRKTDLVVIPSRFDSFPNVGLEAMGVGTPFITSDTEDLRSAFEESTQYVPPGDPDKLAAKIDSLQRPGPYRTLRDQCLTHRKKFCFDWIEQFENEVMGMIE